jgi:hypothetical protein
MMAAGPLLADRPSPVAVRTSDLAFLDLMFERCDRTFAVGQLNYAATLDTDMIEIQHCRVILAAVDARGGLEVALQEAQVATAERPRIVFDALLPPRACAPPGPSPVTVRAYELTGGDLCDHTI